MKITTRTLMTSVALVALAGPANAATQINIYGSSSQFNLWKAVAIPFITAATAAGGLGCFAASTLGPTLDSVDGKTFIVQASGCDTIFTDGSVDFRVGSKASYDGIYAATGNDDPLSVSSSRGSCDRFSRLLADGPASNDSTVKTTRNGCYPITLGTSDTPTNAYVQVTSSGNQKGPYGGGAISRSFSGIPLSGTVNGSTLVAPLATYQPVKVPFGFFVNNNVTAKICAIGSFIGEYCGSDSDCGTGGACGTTATTINNMSREMATQLFGQSIKNWSQMTGFTAQSVVLCMRHAGSGAHTTFDLAVMNKSWGKLLPSREVTNTLLKPITWFNDSTADLFNCMTYPGYTGSVGYADADASHDVSKVTGPIRYNSFYPTRQNIISGIYDFYADQTVYLTGNATTQQKAVADRLLSSGGYLNNSTGSHLSGTAFRNFWAASLEMKVSRSGGNPFIYPSR